MAPPTPGSIDWLVVTASSRSQAAGYRAMLSRLRSSGTMKGVRRWLVAPDPMDQRAGSGNATIIALARVLSARLAETRKSRTRTSVADLLSDQKILIIHSGGDSRRLPAYAAGGKLFLPLSRRNPDHTRATMFDLILSDLSAVLRNAADSGATLIASGDVLLNASAHPIRLGGAPVAGVAFPSTKETASRHGVYVCNDQGEVREFLQKPDIKTLRHARAMRPDGTVLVDSGIVMLNHIAAAKVLRACGVSLDHARGNLRFSGESARMIGGKASPLDLYEHVLMAASGSSIGPPVLARTLNHLGLAVRVTPTCDFLHVGTTTELLDLAATDERLAGDETLPRRTVQLATAGREHLDLARSSGANWIDACDLRSRVSLRGRNVLVGAEVARAITLPRRWGVVIFPIRGGRFVPMAFGDRDDFKTPVDLGGTLGNRPFSSFIARFPKSVRIWTDADTPAAARTLYEARIWPVVRSRSEALHAIEWLWTPDAPAPRRWIAGERLSASEAVRACDHRALIAHRQALASRMAAGSLKNLDADPMPTLEIGDLAPTEAKKQLAPLVRSARREPSPSRRASRLWIASEVAAIGGGEKASLQQEAIDAVAEAVGRSVDESQVKERPSSRRDPVHLEQATWASAPARIDLAGGWSDTPPICHDLGGTVVNAAIRAGNHAAVHAIVRRTEKPGIVVASTDLGRSTRIRSIAQLRPPFNPTQWSALTCAAISLTAGGASPPKSIEAVTRALWGAGGGLHITTYSTLPKGSGLGTSSILGATLLAALADACGERCTLSTLFMRTLMLEQRLGTGGGWQDQVGGLAPGIKLLKTKPGLAQMPRCTHLADELFHDPKGPCPILYFTGVRRMARGILRGVVGRYLARDPSTLRTINALKSGAEAMAHAIGKKDHGEVAHRLAEYWSLKRSIDPGAAHPEVDALADTLKKDLLAWELPGAGGGGYLFMLANDPDAAARVRRTLTRNPLNEHARLAPFSFDSTGLRVLRT